MLYSYLKRKPLCNWEIYKKWVDRKYWETVETSYRLLILLVQILFCYYAIKRQISTKLIGENMFCMEAHQLYIDLPSKSRLVQLRIYTSYMKTCFFLSVTCYFSRMTNFWSFVLFRCYNFIRSKLDQSGFRW
jgi:hypothetical protein